MIPAMKYYFLFSLFLFHASLSAQSIDTLKCNQGRIDLGIEIQGYPAGIIPVITTNLFFANQLAFRIRAGGNFANRHNWSPYNDFETAQGYGGSLGLVTYHPYKIGHFTAGVTIDLWHMTTQWKDHLDTPNPTQGVSQTLVFQPWADIGYLFNIRNTRLNIGGTLGFGKEINIVTKGDSVGEGWMNSLTLTVNYTMKR